MDADFKEIVKKIAKDQYGCEVCRHAVYVKSLEKYLPCNNKYLLTDNACINNSKFEISYERVKEVYELSDELLKVRADNIPREKQQHARRRQGGIRRY